MALLINLRNLERTPQELAGELAPAELDLEIQDEIVHVKEPLSYSLVAEQLESGILVRGSVRINLDCECARCLKAFKYPLELEEWVCHLALEGEEKVAIVNDCVDLTPYIREDIILEFPQHPLCKPECGGLLKRPGGKKTEVTGTGQIRDSSSAWAELNKLKL